MCSTVGSLQQDFVAFRVYLRIFAVFVSCVSISYDFLNFLLNIFYRIIMNFTVLPKTTTYEVPESPNKAQKKRIQKDRNFARKLRLE